jgi:hypothetical protein
MTDRRVFLIAVGEIDEAGKTPAVFRYFAADEDKVEEITALLGDPIETVLFPERSLKLGNAAYEAAVHL